MEFININNIDNNDLDKIIIHKNNFYCTNCNKKGHIYKKCTLPIISNGVIAIYINNLNPLLIPLLEDYICKNIKYIKNHNFENKMIFNDKFLKDINENIKFLLVQRKNSLGYLEFMRGRYNINNNELILKLFMQMTPIEINDIINKDFDTLWNNLWDINNIKNKNHQKEYNISKEKFNQLKLQNNIINIKPSFDFNEWGFPKGRRELYESDLVCAIREFEEETCINENDYILFEKCNYIRENLIGTNGINYIHNYFLALLENNNINLENNKNNKEIGNIKILNIKECINIIRPYHNEKINIIKRIYLLINNFIKEYAEISDNLQKN
jgi:hypothetical protein